MAFKRPSHVALMRLLVTTRRSARKEAAVDVPLQRMSNGVAEEAVPDFQLLLDSKLSDTWLQRLAATAAADFTSLNAALETHARERERLRELLREARARVTHVPRFKLDAWTQVAIVLATVLGMITTWPFIQDMEWPFPIAALASVALAAFEVAIAGLLGWSVHALAMDDPDTPFELSVKQHRLFVACAVIAGLISIVAVVVLAVVRGDGRPVWLLLGAGIVALSAYGGLVLHDNKFEQAAKLIEKHLTAVESKLDDLKNAYIAKEHATMADGRSLRGLAAQIDQRVARVFVNTWRRHHRSPGATAPRLPQLELPTDYELRRRLLIAMFDVEDWQAVDGDIVQARPIPLHAKPAPRRRRRALPPGSEERAS